MLAYYSLVWYFLYCKTSSFQAKLPRCELLQAMSYVIISCVAALQLTSTVFIAEVRETPDVS